MVESKEEKKHEWPEIPADVEYTPQYDEINAQYEELIGKLEALIAAPLGKKYSQEKRGGKKEKPALVQWEFLEDGMIRHRIQDKNLRGKKTVVDLKRRQDAIGAEGDFKNDRLLTFLCENAEKIFEPKRILT